MSSNNWTFKGTPGEWRASEHDVISMADIDDGGDIICDAPQYADDSMKRWHENSQLIAAAPDLFEALRMFVEPESHIKDGIDPRIDAGRAALAKATGEGNE